MTKIKNNFVYLLFLLFSISCDTETQPEESTTDIREPVEIISTSSMDLSLPESAVITQDKTDAESNEELHSENLKFKLDKPSDNNYKFSGELHLDPDNNESELLLEKIDGARINLELKFK